MVGKPRTTCQNPCTAKDLVSTTLVNPVVNALEIESFPLIPGVAENRSNRAVFVRVSFPVATWSVFLRLWTDALAGGCHLARLSRPQSTQKKPAGRTGGFEVMSVKRG
jgi:hypothetical protein